MLIDSLESQLLDFKIKEFCIILEKNIVLDAFNLEIEYTKVAD